MKDEAKNLILADEIVPETSPTNPMEIISYKGSIKKIVRVASATLPIQVIKVAFPFLNSIILSHRGVTDRNAALLINSMEDFTRNVMNAPLYYVQTAIGMLNNKKDKGKIGQTAQAGWLFALLVSIPQVVILVLSKPILDAIGEDRDTTEVVKDFFNIYAISMPLLSLQLVNEQIALSTEKIYFPVVILTCGLITYISLAYPLAFGAWGAPELGIDGTAWAFFCRGIVYTLLSFGGLKILSRPNKMFSPFNLFKWDGEGFLAVLKTLCIKGAPLFLILSSELGIMYVTNILISRLNDKFLTPQLIISQYQDTLLISTWAFAIAAQNEISNNVKINKQNVMRLGNVSIGLSFITPVIYTSIVLFAPQILLIPFIDPNDPENQYTVNLLINDKLLLISAVSYFLLNLRYLTTQALVGIGQTGVVLTVNMLLTWLGVALGAGMAFGGLDQDNGIFSLNLGLLVGFFLSGVAQTVHWAYKARPSVLERLEIEAAAKVKELLDESEQSLLTDSAEGEQQIEDEQLFYASVSALNSPNSPAMFSTKTTSQLTINSSIVKEDTTVFDTESSVSKYKVEKKRTCIII